MAAEVGATLPAGWALASDTQDAQASASDDHAASVAETYHDDLERTAGVLLAAWLAQHDGDHSGAAAALAAGLGTWAAARAVWKVPQVAGYETIDAYNDGGEDAAGDLTDGTLSPDDGTVLAPDAFYVTVLPEGAAEIFCQMYAGQEFSIDDAEEIYNAFPAHISCDHYGCIVAR